VLKEKEMRLYGEFRTGRLVLEAWDARDGVPVSGVPVSSEPPPASIQPIVIEEKKERSVPVRKEPEPVEENPSQPMLPDFGLYSVRSAGRW
jgi:hypothetical protein